MRCEADSSKHKSVISRRHEIRFLILLTVGVCVPVMGTLSAIFLTAEPNISELSPIVGIPGDYTVLNWIELERGRSHALRQGTNAFTGARVQVLGYMMEVDQPLPKGKRVREFVLLPDAGNLLHPAHRFGDQMIAVHLAVGNETAFNPRSLVWVKGLLRASSGDPAGAKPLYHLEEATAFPASKMDIKRYFR